MPKSIRAAAPHASAGSEPADSASRGTAIWASVRADIDVDAWHAARNFSRMGPLPPGEPLADFRVVVERVVKRKVERVYFERVEAAAHEGRA